MAGEHPRCRGVSGFALQFEPGDGHARLIEERQAQPVQHQDQGPLHGLDPLPPVDVGGNRQVRHHRRMLAGQAQGTRLVGRPVAVDLTAVGAGMAGFRHVREAPVRVEEQLDAAGQAGRVAEEDFLMTGGAAIALHGTDRSWERTAPNGGRQHPVPAAVGTGCAEAAAREEAGPRRRLCVGGRPSIGTPAAGQSLDQPRFLVTAPQITRRTMAPTMAPMKPAPSPGPYQPTACPSQVATRAPTIPRIVVRMKARGLVVSRVEKLRNHAGDEADDDGPDDGQGGSSAEGLARERRSARPVPLLRRILLEIGQRRASAQKIADRMQGIRHCRRPP